MLTNSRAIALLEEIRDALNRLSPPPARVAMWKGKRLSDTNDDELMAAYHHTERSVSTAAGAAHVFDVTAEMVRRGMELPNG